MVGWIFGIILALASIGYFLHQDVSWNRFLIKTGKSWIKYVSQDILKS